MAFIKVVDMSELSPESQKLVRKIACSLKEPTVKPLEAPPVGEDVKLIMKILSDHVDRDEDDDNSLS